VAWTQADLVPPGDWDVVASNPPYVPDGDVLPPGVAGHEPGLALWGGPDGLDVLRRLIEVRAPLLAVEVGAGQAPEVAALAVAAGWVGTELVRDLAGIGRVVIAWR
jgi:release factor glutamine methyltransferase